MKKNVTKKMKHGNQKKTSQKISPAIKTTTGNANI